MADEYQRNYEIISKLIGMDLEEWLKGEGIYIKLKADGFMDLHIDKLGGRRFSMAHNYIQNGDVMADPDMILEFSRRDDGKRFVEPLTYQQDCFGIFHEVYDLDENGQKIKVRIKLKKGLQSFLTTWLNNLINQEFKVAERKER